MRPPAGPRAARGYDTLAAAVQPHTTRKATTHVYLLPIVQIAQICTAIGTLVALGCSIYIANRARTEVRTDRAMRALPIVIFEPGGYGISERRRTFRHRIPGCDTAAVEADFKSIARDAQVSDCERPYGRARNVGLGPALDVQVRFLPRKLVLGSDSYTVDETKLAESRFSAGYNTLPLSNRVMLPDAVAELPRLPTFICLDIEDRITEAHGELVIRYRGVAHQHLETVQEFSYWVWRATDSRVTTMTFRDVVKTPELQATKPPRFGLHRRVES